MNDATQKLVDEARQFRANHSGYQEFAGGPEVEYFGHEWIDRLAVALEAESARADELEGRIEDAIAELDKMRRPDLVGTGAFDIAEDVRWILQGANV